MYIWYITYISISLYYLISLRFELIQIGRNLWNIFDHGTNVDNSSSFHVEI